jgi:poly(hydroxyalkanoate) depolymerase family esterase
MNRASPRLCVVLTVFAGLTAACATEPPEDEPPVHSVAQAVTLSQVTSFGSNPGALKMFKYVPAGLPSGAPLVVALHGCTESASSYSTQTEWGNLADRFHFAVVFAEQQNANNSSGCFNWFQPGDISRDQGEALSIKQMVDTMKSSTGSDPARIFVTGMSAGGYFTEVMMAAYPDVFAAGSVNSGGAYACATSLTATSSCQQGSVSHTPQQWGDLVRNAFPGYTGPYPRMIAFHGSSDFTVAQANLQQSVDQWSNLLGIDETPEVNETFRTATHKVFRNAAGASMIETYLISGMGHALTVDVGTNVDQGGATGAFCEDHDIYSSYYAAQFFGLTTGGGGGGGDTVPPTVSITAPAGGATVTGSIAVTATASDNVGVTRVDVLVDGALMAATRPRRTRSRSIPPRCRTVHTPSRPGRSTPRTTPARRRP